ncbi:SARP family transcriptional regulator, partial [Actinoallomurus acaciae]
LLPLVGVFTRWYAALRLAAEGRAGAEDAYRAAAVRLDGAGMPGVEQGLLPMALLCLRLGPDVEVDPDADWGPYRPWVEPLALLRSGRRADARTALRELGEPPADLTYEALCCLEAEAALELGDRVVLERVHTRLRPAAGELAAGTGLFTAGPVDRRLDAISAALRG